VFYGAEQAGIHDRTFGNLARFAAEDLLAHLAASGLARGTVVDLGCGSGILARAVADGGYDIAGVDISPDMIALAAAKAPEARLQVASLHDFELPSPCVAVAAAGEALNYATDPAAGLAAVARLAERVAAALVPGGWWLLDVSGPGRAGPNGVTKQFFRFPDWCLGMTATESGSASGEGPRLDREITVFAIEEDGRYRRVEEHHVLQLYRPEEIVGLLEAAGFEVSVRADYRSAPPGFALAGWYVVEARKPS